MKFQKYMFNFEIKDKSVAKYLNNDDSIVLVLEKDGEQVKGSERFEFKDQDEFENWLDEFISDEVAIDNPAAALSLLIDKFDAVNKDVEYVERYKTKRKTKVLKVDFYLDNDREQKIYNQLQDADNKKQTVLSALEQYFNA